MATRKGKHGVTSNSNHHAQQDYDNDGLSMFADESSMITTTETQVKATCKNIHTHEKTSCSKLHEGKTLIIKLGKAQTKNITPAILDVNFTIMADSATKTYLDNTIGNTVTEEQSFSKIIQGIEMLGK